MLRIASLLMLVATAAFADDSNVYTLYRSSTLTDARIHVATFDVAEGNNYNRDNCLTAADLFKKQPGVLVQYWCERGRFRK